MLVFFTVIAVSVDAYFAGLAYSLSRKLSAFGAAYAASFTFFVCCAAFELGRAVSDLPLIKETGGAVFIFMGAKSYLSERLKNTLLCKSPPSELWMLGLAVSADAGLAALSMDVPTRFAVPLYAFFMFAAHFFFLLMGALSAGRRRRGKRASALSGVMLMALGFVKLLS